VTEREKRNLRIGFGIAVAVYGVFLAGMSAGQHWVTTCVRSHTFDSGPDSFTVCDYRVANGKTIDFGSPFALLRIPHIPGGPYGVIGYGLVLVLVIALAAAARATRPKPTDEPG
jgi:hypothetical protein